MASILETTRDPQLQVVRRDDRRARLFANACLGMLATLPAFYAIGLLQGGWKAQLVFVMVSVIGFSIGSARVLARRGHLSSGVHLVSACGCIVVVTGSLIAGRVGPAAVLLPTFLAVGLFHTRPAPNHAKSVFLATMSHELRTPLNAVIGYAEMLRQSAQDGDLDPEEAEGDLGRIEDAGRQLLALVSSVLDISRVESGQLVLHPEPVFVVPLLRELADTASPRPGVTVQVDADVPDEVSIDVDRGVLSQIVVQLLANACRFTQVGTITLGARATRATRATRASIAIRVQDTGMGIPTSDLERVFELFTQLDGSTTRTVDGAGLGLALCRRLAHHLGATLTVESRPGLGSTFTLELGHEVAHPQELS